MGTRTATITFRLSEVEKQQIESIAEQMDIPVSQLLRKIIKEYFQERGYNNDYKFQGKLGEIKCGYL